MPKTIPDLVVLDDGTDRERWLRARVGIITATKAAAIVGSHPYSKLIDVWNEHTDPEYDRDRYRNQWLDERAQNGSDREPEILAWASERPWSPGKRWTPGTALYVHPEHPTHGATPDAFALVRGKTLELAEAKTTQQDWKGVVMFSDGLAQWADATDTALPQHIVDQCLWQLYVTGAERVRVYVERTEWSGRGANRTATIVGREAHIVEPDPARLQVILDEVARFERYVAEGIAPESDLRIADLTDVDPFTAEPDDLALATTLGTLDDLLDEIDEIDRKIAEQTKRRTAAEAEAKRLTKSLGFEGRRVHLIGERRIVKLTRFLQAKVHDDRLPAALVRAATTWEQRERIAIEPNPEYIPPVAAPAADTTEAD